MVRAPGGQLHIFTETQSLTERQSHTHRERERERETGTQVDARGEQLLSISQSLKTDSLKKKMIKFNIKLCIIL